ncbi:hypothetical protein CPLU01_01997 [Colletotrichum plurivorum]|uniref:Uncharacterized protein n=1 Tax=Colletotrichum plurivorum TaxID=2175906 RepID=A0A8H6KX22_9PEZI|nr:hypothetical protein CPLU01_01997 [Colletotrichum plurivorum]
MADEREEISRLYGPPRITIVPHEGLEDGPPQLHASRLPSQRTFRRPISTSTKLTPLTARTLRMIQPLEPWYSPSRSAEVAPAPTVSASQRVQKRWLFNSFPEAFQGSSEAADPLAEGIAQIMRPDAAPTAQPLLAISQMADVSKHKYVVPIPVIAMATGESGELLRLSKLDETKWDWGENVNPSLRLLKLDEIDREETVIWSTDGAPISQIKSALSLVRFEPIRWLLVQKKMSTTILQPEYHKIPVSERPPGVDKGIERPSRINPKPIITITSEQTGGIAHSDVSFRHGSQKKPPQLAIIDECGYYSVWDIKGRDKKIGSASKRAKLRHCGHIELGVQEQLPDEDSPAFRSEPHGVLWIGAAGPGVDLWDVPAEEDEDMDMGNDLAALTEQSKKLLLWNRAKFEVIDVKDPGFRKSLSILRSDMPDHILDVKPNPVNRSQVFVLTTCGLFWIETSSQGTAAAKTGGLTVLQSFAHLRSLDADSLKLTVHHAGHGRSSENSTAYIYSEKTSEVDVYQFSVPESTGLPQFQHQRMRVADSSNLSEDKMPKMHTLCLAAAFFYPRSPDSSGSLRGPGAEYLNHQVKFQQLFILGRDLDLSQTLLAVSPSSDIDIVSPDTCQEWSRRGRRTMHKRRRKRFLHYFEETFVVPDGLEDMDDLVVRHATRYQELLQMSQPGAEPAEQRFPRLFNFDLFTSRIAVSVDSIIVAAENPNPNGPLSVFDAVREATLNCLETEGGYIPLHTLHEYEASFEAPPMTEEAIAAWDSRLQQLFNPEEHRVVSQPFSLQLLRYGDTRAPLSDILTQLQEVWSIPDFPPEAQRSRSVVLAETAEAIARALFGVAVLDENLTIAEDEPPTWVPTPPERTTQHSSQRLSLSSQRHSLSSQRYSMSSQRDSLSSQRISMSPIKPRLSMSPIKPRYSMSPLKPRRSMSPSKPSSSAALPSSLPFSSQPFSSSAPGSQSSAAAAAAAQEAIQAASEALQRLSMLAVDIDVTAGPERQHQVLSYWPTKRGVSTESYVSSVLASSNKHLDAIKERRERVESRRRKRKSQLFGGSSNPGSSQPATTQDEMTDSAPGEMFAPATQPMPRLAPPIIESSQPSSPKRSQQPFIFSSQVPQTMSQPLAGRHGMRSPKKKGKRKSGF